MRTDQPSLQSPSEHPDGADVAEHLTPASVPSSSGMTTPVMRQYLEIKERYADCILFFRLGDFYEMFYDDAVVASQILDLTLTARDKNRENPVPLCGVPHHAGKQYLAKLVAAGKKVAICEQIEDAKKTKKMVRRAVTQVVTPGVILDEEQLEPRAGHYLAAVCFGPGEAGVAYVDVSTGEFAGTTVGLADAEEELARIAPAELLIVSPDETLTGERAEKLASRLRIPIGHSKSQPPHVETRELAGLLDAEATPGPLLLSAGAACVRYARATQPTSGLPIFSLRLYQPGDSLVIDETTRTNLELLETLMERKRQGSLIGVLDHTKTAMGGRLLRRWLLAPLLHVSEIRRRQDAVAWAVAHQAARQGARELLAQVYDLERLAGRLGAGVATPRDLWSLGQGLRRLPGLRQLLTAEDGTQTPDLLTLPKDLGHALLAAIEAAIADNPPLLWREGGFIKPGFHAGLDELVELSRGGKAHIQHMEDRERERSGISSLKIRFNKIFGYYIEITRSNLSRVPSDYLRKQTTANAERYVTPELAEYEAKVLGAEERRMELELELFDKLRLELSVHTRQVLELGGRVASLDSLLGLAELAHKSGYSRPEVTDGLVLEIEEGRHPVIEAIAQRGRFVPNDTRLHPDEEQLLILTGPNMAGKSTVMRQVALIVLLAQLGSFVPAKRAVIGIADRICTRVGAADNLSRGDSTFMVEMRETSHILRRATRRSLVILDEIGRGTSTYDGVSIAWAVAEHLHNQVGCRTMFATHYHELAALAQTCPRVRNFSVAVRQRHGEIVFLHKLVEGGASRSFGIEVARLAGLPPSVVQRAKEILADLEDQSQGTPTTSQLPLFSHRAQDTTAPADTTTQTFSIEGAAVLAELAALDCDGLTPRQALDRLASLKSRLAAHT